MLLDFGSGHQPREGFKLCDVDGYAIDYQFDALRYRILGLPDSSVTVLHCRNVLHHVFSLDYLAEEFHRVLKPGGIVHIIDCTPAAFPANVFLDRLWYRGIIPRPKVWIAEKYRDYAKTFSTFFNCLCKRMDAEKEEYIFQKGSVMTEEIRKQLDEAGYDYAVAVATEAEIENGAACGQLSVITDEIDD